MTIDSGLIDAVARFTNSDVDAFRREWNAQMDNENKTPEKKQAFENAKKHVQGQNLLAGGISVRVSINYTSLSGETKQRDVIIRRVFKAGKDILIDGFCLDIQAPRLIKMQNILQITDIQTKTLYTRPCVFFEDVLGIDLVPEEEKVEQTQEIQQPVETYSFNSSLKNGELKTAIDRTRHEITALLFVAAIDGHRDNKELIKTIEYVHKRCPDLSFDDADMMKYLQMNYPDTQSFYFALERILGKEGWVVRMFLEKLMELILVDGKKDEKEKLFLADFLRVLEEEGFELNFKTA